MLDGDEPELHQPCDEWHKLIVAAEAAGRWAASELARRSSVWHLGRTGNITIHIEHLASPVASWLHHTGRAVPTKTDTGVLVPVQVTAASLYPADEAVAKAGSLLVAHAYAVAYCSLLGDEAGVATEIRIASRSVSNVPRRFPQPRRPRTPPRQAPCFGLTSTL